MTLSNPAPVALAIVTMLLPVGCKPLVETPEPGSQAQLETQLLGESWHATTQAPVCSRGRLAWLSIQEDVSGSESRSAAKRSLAEVRSQDAVSLRMRSATSASDPSGRGSSLRRFFSWR